MTTALGIDVGGSGIKGAIVDTRSGQLVTERRKILTPDGASPAAVADVIKQLTTGFGWTGPVGIAFPGLVMGGTIMTAPNLGTEQWANLYGPLIFQDASPLPVTVLNDADAAGVAEMTHGAGKGVPGSVMVLTFGTGIGTALFHNGVLVPNMELGHLEIGRAEAEHQASSKVRDDLSLSWKQWAARVTNYLQHLEMLMSPQLFILGGGISRKSDKFLDLIETTRASVVPAAFNNNAGIIGAAMAAVG